jgi:hypothetical protein
VCGGEESKIDDDTADADKTEDEAIFIRWAPTTPLPRISARSGIELTFDSEKAMEVEYKLDTDTSKSSGMPPEEECDREVDELELNDSGADWRLSTELLD